MDTPILLLLLLSTRENTTQGADLLHTFKGYINGIQLDYKYTADKIRIVRKIRPYLPVEYIDIINKSIVITEKLVRLMEVKEFVNSVEVDEIKPVDMEPKDKMLKVVHIIQEDVKSTKMNNLGFALDLIGNIDNYKNMFELLNTVKKDGKTLSDPDSIFKLMETFVGSSPKDKEKVKELTKMMDLFKLLDTSKKETPMNN